MLPGLSKIDSQEVSDEERTKASKLNLDQLLSSGKPGSSRMNQINKSKSPFKSNENLNNVSQQSNGGQISSSKFDSIRSTDQYAGRAKPTSAVQNSRQTNS